jgi:hypothetical protein
MSDDVINLEEERRRKADARTVAEEAKRDTRIITQDGVASIFAKQYADSLRYCHSTGAWFEFNGFLWRRDEKSRASNLSDRSPASSRRARSTRS